MKPVFYSRSAKRESNVTKISPKKLILNDTVLWYGKQDALSKLGVTFGHEIIDSIQDNSSLLCVKALIFRETSLESYIQKINFAVNYDIPVVWLHSHLIPHNWIWSFKLCFIGEINPLSFWIRICEMID